MTDLDDPAVPPPLDGIAPMEPPQKCPRCKKERPAIEFDRVPKTGRRKTTCHVCLSFQRDRRHKREALTWSELEARTAPREPATTLPAVVTRAPRPVPSARNGRPVSSPMQGGIHDAMFCAQRGLCAACRRPETALDEHGQVRKLVAYFNTTNGCVRGLICAACVTGFHAFSDSPALMAMGLAFLTGEPQWGTAYRMEIVGA